MSERDRVADLERRLAALEAKVSELADARPDAATRSTAAGRSTGAWAPPAREVLPPPVVVAPPATPRPTRHLELDGERLLKWGGAVLVVLAVAFAVSTAISRGWIGPGLQLAGAIALSVTLVVVGMRVEPRRRGWAHALCSAGVAAAFTTFASNLFLDNATTIIASAATVVVAAVGLLVAHHVRSPWVAAVVAIGGLTGWMVINDREPQPVPTALWIVVLVAAVLALATRHRWFGTRIVGYLVGMIGLLAVTGELARPVEQVVVVAAAAFLVAAAMTVLPSVPRAPEGLEPVQAAEIQLATLMPPWAVAITASILDTGSRQVGAAALAIAAVVAVVAVALRRRILLQHRISLLVGASVAASIGVVALLHGHSALGAIAVQGAGLMYLTRRWERDDGRILFNAVVLLVIAAAGAVPWMSDAWRVDAPIGDDVAHAIVVAATAAAAWFARDRALRLLAAAGALAMFLVWLGSVLVHLPQGQAIVSATWAATGTVILVLGVVRRATEIAGAGLVVLGATVAKLLTVDLRTVDTLWRAGLFLLVGVGFLRLGFLLPRLGGRRDDADGHP